MIDREVVVRLDAELREVLLVARSRPSAPCARRSARTRRLHAVFVLQAERDHFELQLADRAQDQVVVAQRLEQLRRALLAQLRRGPSRAPSS